MGFKAEDRSIYDLLNDKMYSVPTNQRKYVWEQQNWEELFEDVKLVVESKTTNHFLGSIVLIKENIEDGIHHHFCIIDGQQRISTITVFLCAIGYLFVESGDLDLFEGLTKNLQVWDSRKKPFSIVSKNANREIDRLVSRLVDAVEIRKKDDFCFPLMSIHELASDASLSKKIEKCLSYFYAELKKSAIENPECLENYKKAILAMRYIDIVADSSEDAYTVFEILNARGQPLTDFELLRNYLLKNTSTEEKTDVIESLDEIENLLGTNTELFLKHYVMHKYGIKSSKTDRPYKILVKQEKANNTIRFLVDLMQKALYYNRIITYENCNEFEKKVFSFFKPRRQQQFRPIVLSLMHQRDLKSIDEKRYEDALRFLYEFFIYFNVIGEQTSNKIEDVVYTYAFKLENNFDDSILNDMKLSMSKRIPSSIDSFRTSIQNIRYSSKWKTYSGSKKAENVRAILEIIEKEAGFKGDFDTNKITIEHIAPDAESEDNSVIGNMILLESDLNERCKNKTISEKINIYKESKLNLPKEIDASSFNIQNRTEQIVKIVYKLINELQQKNSIGISRL